MSEASREDFRWARRHEVLYNAEMSALYHQKRERFFDVWDKLSKALALVAGSAALYRIADAKIVGVLAIAITATSALSLVFGFAERARRHAALAANFKDLCASIVGAGPHDFTDANMDDWEARRCKLEMTEPPALGLLVVLCQNELAIAQKQPEKVVRLGLVRRLAANYIDLAIPCPRAKAT